MVSFALWIISNQAAEHDHQVLHQLLEFMHAAIKLGGQTKH